MDFIVNNWIYFGVSSFVFALLMFGNLIYTASRGFRSVGNLGDNSFFSKFLSGFIFHLFFALMLTSSSILFLIGLIVQIIRTSSNH